MHEAVLNVINILSYNAAWDFETLDYSYFDNNRRKERTEYQEKWDINEDKAARLQSDIQSMFQKRLAIDGRFLSLDDARKLCSEFFDENKCVIVSVSTTEEYYKQLTEVLSKHSNAINDFFTAEINFVKREEGQILLGRDAFFLDEMILW